LSGNKTDLPRNSLFRAMQRSSVCATQGNERDRRPCERCVNTTFTGYYKTGSKM